MAASSPEPASLCGPVVRWVLGALVAGTILVYAVLNRAAVLDPWKPFVR